MSGTEATVNPGFGDGPDPADDKPKDEQKPKGEEEESLVTKLTSWMESPTAITIIACVTIVMSIISISTAASAYGTLNSRASDFRGLVDSWIRPPITSLSLPSSSTGSCSGSDTVLFEPSRLAWPGAAAGYCACPRSAVARDIISTTDSCNSNQTNAGCVTDPAIESITMLWKGAATVCAGRDATPRLYQENGAGPRKERPAPTAAGTCPTGWKACGPGLYNDDGSICVRTSESCPVTRVDRLTAAEWASRSSEYDGSVQLGGGSFGDSYYLAWASASAGASADDLYLPYMPFSESQPSLYEELCVGEGRHWYSQASRSTNGNGPTRDSRSCPDAGTDSRWFVVDSTDDTGTEGFLRENFDLNARCTGSNSGNSEVGNIDCSPGDTICTDVRDTGRCQKLRNFATGQSVSVGFMARKEVFWANGCEVDPVFLADRVAPTDDAVGSLLIVLVVNIICNVITMGFCIYIISMVCCCTEDEDGDGNIDNEVKAKYKKIKWGKTVVLGLMGLGKIIPMAVVLGGINSLRTDFDKAKEADCGDAEANETITFLETTLDDAYTNAIISFVSDGFSLAYALYLLVAMLLGWGEEEPSTEPSKEDDAAAEES